LECISNLRLFVRGYVFPAAFSEPILTFKDLVALRKFILLQSQTTVLGVEYSNAVQAVGNARCDSSQYVRTAFLDRSTWKSAVELPQYLERIPFSPSSRWSGKRRAFRKRKLRYGSRVLPERGTMPPREKDTHIPLDIVSALLNGAFRSLDKLNFLDTEGPCLRKALVRIATARAYLFRIGKTLSMTVHQSHLGRSGLESEDRGVFHFSISADFYGLCHRLESD
jgi:hypothetical protein